MRHFRLVSLSLVACLLTIPDSVGGQTRSAPLKTVPITTPDSPPEWALFQRHMLKQLHPAAMSLVKKYTKPNGELIWRDEWPGMDGSDDGYESFYNFPLYYALGGHEQIAPLALAHDGEAIGLGAIQLDRQALEVLGGDRGHGVALAGGLGRAPRTVVGIRGQLGDDLGRRH